MNLGILEEGDFIARRQRFFADVRLGDRGTVTASCEATASDFPSVTASCEATSSDCLSVTASCEATASDCLSVTAHCANTGSMRSQLLPGTRALLGRAANPERKLGWDLQLLRLPDGTLACVNTALPNRLVAEALAAGRIPGLPKGAVVKSEAVAGPGTRLDFRVEPPDAPPCWIEVKNVTLVEPERPGVAMFPDAVSARGLKHLRTLTDMKARGERAIIFYLLNRTDALDFAPAAHLDPAYAEGLAAALVAGVEVWLGFVSIRRRAGQWHVRIREVRRWGRMDETALAKVI